jgi:hypothetical protein
MEESNLAVLLLYDDPSQCVADSDALHRGQVGAHLDADIWRRAASIRWDSSGDSTIVVREHSESSNSASPRLRPLKVKSKVFSALFDGHGSARQSGESPPRSTPGSTMSESLSPGDKTNEALRMILSEKRSLPLSHISSRRTRFIGLGNGDAGATWAVLDKDILMKRAEVEDFGRPMSHSSKARAVRFPHAVLDVRWEGQLEADLVRALDQSHLVSHRVSPRHTLSLTTGYTSGPSGCRLFARSTRKRCSLRKACQQATSMGMFSEAP